MTSFATEVSGDICREPKFWEDLACLRAVGIRSTLSAETPTSKQKGRTPQVAWPSVLG